MCVNDLYNCTMPFISVSKSLLSINEVRKHYGGGGRDDSNFMLPNLHISSSLGPNMTDYPINFFTLKVHNILYLKCHLS